MEQSIATSSTNNSRSTSNVSSTEVTEDQAFDEEAKADLYSLMSVLRDISTHDSDVGKRRKDLLTRNLDNYERLVNKTTFSEHQDYFYQIYCKNRTSILSTYDDPSWLEGNIVVWYGHQIPSVKSRNIKLSLSLFYAKAKCIRDELDESYELQLHEQKLRGKKIEAQPVEDDSYYYIDEMLYYLLKVFKHCIRGTRHAKDSGELGNVLSELSKDLKLEGPRTSTAANGIEGLFKSIMGFAGQCGLKTPDGQGFEGLHSFDCSQITNTFQTLITNDNFKDVIGRAVSSIDKSQGPSDPGSFVDILTSVARDVAPVISEVIANTETPPPGVSDTRTPEQKAKDIEKITEAAASVESVINSLTSSFSSATSVTPNTSDTSNRSEPNNEVPEINTSNL